MNEASGLVRIATPEDTDGIMACLKIMHDENGLFSLAHDRVRGIVEGSVNPVIGSTSQPIIGVIGTSDNIEATTCLVLTTLYYTDDWHLGDLWNFIRPDCRKKMHIDALVEFAKQCSDRLGVPLMSAVVSNKRTEAKVRIYQKHFGPSLGAFFIYRPKLGVELAKRGI